MTRCLCHLKTYQALKDSQAAKTSVVKCIPCLYNARNKVDKQKMMLHDGTVRRLMPVLRVFFCLDGGCSIATRPL